MHPGVVAPAVRRGAAVEHASEGEELRGHLAQLGQESCPRHGVVSAATVQRNPDHITTRRQSLVRSITSKNLQSAWETIPKSTLTTCTAERKKKRERERERGREREREGEREREKHVACTNNQKPRCCQKPYADTDQRSRSRAPCDYLSHRRTSWSRKTITCQDRGTLPLLAPYERLCLSPEKVWAYHLKKTGHHQVRYAPLVCPEEVRLVMVP